MSAGGAALGTKAFSGTAGSMMRPVDEGLTTIDIDMAQQLQSYSKKITQLRKASGDDVALSRPRAERRRRNRRTRQLRSEAEDYRRARLAQRVVWVICSVQMLSTVLLAILSHPAFAVTLVGYGFGMAASFARVQRHHAVCMVFNMAYGLVSFGEPSALLAEIVQSGSPEGLMRKLPRRHPLGVVVLGVFTTVACIFGVLGAAYCIARPLMLHRYESVASDEKTAGRREDRLAGARGGGAAESDDDDDDDDDDEGVQPIEAWMNAGEVGVPLVFMPVVAPKRPRPAQPKHWSTEEIVPLPTLPPPPDTGTAAQASVAKSVEPGRAGGGQGGGQGGGGSPELERKAALASHGVGMAPNASILRVSSSEALEEATQPLTPRSAAAPRLPAPGDSVAALMHEDEEVEEEAAAEAEAAAATAQEAEEAARVARGTARETIAATGAASAAAAAPSAAAASTAVAPSVAVGAKVEVVASAGPFALTATDRPPKDDSEEGSERGRRSSAGDLTAHQLPAPPSSSEGEEGGAGAGGGGGGGGGGGVGGEGGTLRERMRQKASGLKEAAVTSGWDFGVVGKLSEPKAAETAEVLFERAKLLHKAQKYKQAVELIEEAHALQPKVSTALSNPSPNPDPNPQP